MAHRTEVLKTEQGAYGICSCGWHTPQALASFEAAKLQVNQHRIAELVRPKTK